MILLPSCEWRVGKPNVKIRKAAVICMVKLMEQDLIEKDKMMKHFKKIIEVVK
jgi:hypothetical protein